MCYLTALSSDHPAIGEAIDEDASGFLSIHEVNHFLTKKPEQYSTPTWLVLFAHVPLIAR